MTFVLALALTLQGPPGTDIYVAELRHRGNQLTVGPLTNATHRPGYDNQPFFLPDGRAFLFTVYLDGQADVFRYDLDSARSVRLTATPESEYSPTPLPDGSGFSVVRVERDSTQRLWRFDWSGAADKAALVLTRVQPVGYHAWADAHTLALFVLGAPATLQIADTKADTARVVARDIGRGVARVPGKAAVSFVQKAADSVWTIMELDVATLSARPLVRTIKGVDVYAWTPDGILLMAQGSQVFSWRAGQGEEWTPLADFSVAAVTGITRLAVSPRGDRLAVVAADPHP